MTPAKRRIFVIRQTVVIAISLVRRGHHNLLDGRCPAAGFEQCPGALDIRLPRRDRIAVGYGYDGLGREMNDCAYFILTECAFQRCLIAHVSADNFGGFNQAGTHQLTPRNPVTHQAHNVRALIDEAADQASADKSGCAGHKSRSIKPKVPHNNYSDINLYYASKDQLVAAHYDRSF